MEIGSKIKNLRLKKGLTQEELGDRCELSKGFISLLESDKTSPSMATLEDILNVLGTDFAHFFKEESNRRVVYGKDDYSVKKDTDLKNEICWLIPNAQKNEMEPIRITLKAGGRTKDEDPHEGELFGYVLAGNLAIHIGQQTYRAKKGESFYFRPTARHYIEAAGKTGASFIWVSTPPSF